MSKFQQDATLLLTAVGGRENISAVTHCVTRMRFVLVEPKKADIARIEAIGCVRGVYAIRAVSGDYWQCGQRFLSGIYRVGRY